VVKECTLCGDALTEGSFHRDSRAKSGRRSRCAGCVSKESLRRSKLPPVVDPDKTHKVCTKCQLTLPLDSFGVARRMKDGKNSRCRTCCSEATSLWQKTEVGRKKHVEAVQRYRERKRWGGKGS